MNMQLNEKKNESILNISFNQDNSCFAIGTENNFKIYQSQPLKGPIITEMNGGISNIEMINRSNILALKGGGQIPIFPNKTVILWDALNNKVISELKFLIPVINIKIIKDLLFIICLKRIYIFNINSYEIRDTIDTGENKNGLIAINKDKNITLFGFIAINSCNKISIKNIKKNKITTFVAHDDQISFMTMNNDGTLIASSNEKGTSIKVHSCLDGTLIQEFKRGNKKVENIYITINDNSKLLAVCSSKGTIHFFYLGDKIFKLKKSETVNVSNIKKLEEKNNIKTNDNNKIQIIEPKNKILFFSKIEKSFTKYKMKSKKSICAFLGEKTIIIVTYDYKYYQMEIDLQNGGNLKLVVEKDLSK